MLYLYSLCCEVNCTLHYRFCYWRETFGFYYFVTCDFVQELHVLQQELLYGGQLALLHITSSRESQTVVFLHFCVRVMSGVVKTLHEFPSKYDEELQCSEAHSLLPFYSIWSPPCFWQFSRVCPSTSVPLSSCCTIFKKNAIIYGFVTSFLKGG